MELYGYCCNREAIKLYFGLSIFAFIRANFSNINLKQLSQRTALEEASE